MDSNGDNNRRDNNWEFMGARCVGYSSVNTKFPPKITLEVTVRVFSYVFIYLELADIIMN